MDRERIIAELKAELHRLDGAIAALDTDLSSSANGMRRAKRTHLLTPAGRRRLSEMMKRRWAERRKSGGGPLAGKRRAGKVQLRRRKSGLTPAGRRKLSLMMKKRWAERRKKAA